MTFNSNKYDGKLTRPVRINKKLLDDVTTIFQKETDKSSIDISAVDVVRHALECYVLSSSAVLDG